MIVARRAAFVALAALGLGTPACDRPTPPAASGRAGAAAPLETGLVPLTPDAARQAGIETEVVHRAPFAVTLPLQCRLSPSAETAEEVEARLNFQAADARFVRSGAEVERLRKLYAQDVVSAKAVQAAEGDFAEARVERQRAQTALNNMGLDIARQEIFPKADIWALAEIYEPQINQVKPGARAFLHVGTFPDETFPARLVSLARFLKPQTRTLTVRIAVTDPRRRLRPQEIGTAEIEISEREALSVPDASLLYEGTARVLFVRRPGGFEKVRVRVGAEKAGRIEILEGLAEGDEVVTRGAQALLGEMFKTRIPVEKDERDGEPGGD